MRAAVPLLATILLGATCSEPSDVDHSGTLAVSVRTNGGDVDLDGYRVRVGSDSDRTVPPSGTVYFDGLSPGPYTVNLTGVADNCDVVFSASRQVEIAAADTTLEEYVVECATTGVVVAVRVTGLDQGDQYTAGVDGNHAPIAPQGVHVFTRLAPGQHAVALSDVPSNCAVTGSNPQAVTLARGLLSRVEFDVTCVAATGVLVVTSTTAGQDFDVNGYTVQVGALPPQPMPALATTGFEGLTPGRHELRVGGFAPNCILEGNTVRTFEVTAGGASRDTVRITYLVQCTRRWDVAFTRGGNVFLGSSGDGTETMVGVGDKPAWSPEGEHLAYQCSGVCLAHLNGVGPTHLVTSAPYTVSPAWLPDGRLSVVGLECYGFYCYYASVSGVFVLSLDGSLTQRIQVPSEVVDMYDLDWSPDGRMLAFTCVIAHTEDLCQLSLEGGFTRLTANAGSNRDPAWAPDGSGLVFETTRFGAFPELAFRDPDGRVTRLSPGVDASAPDWLPGGSRIVFASTGILAGQRGLYLMNRDGSGIVRLTTSADYGPAWRP